MDDQPNLDLLNRDSTKAVIATNVGAQLVAIRSLVDYGSNLIPRAIGVETKSIGVTVAIGVFLKQVVAMADAVEVLLAEGSVFACHLPARGAFEASLYLDYVLERDADRRARRFYVADIRDQLAWARKGIPGTLEAAAHVSLQQQFGAAAASPETQRVAEAAHAEMLKILDQADLKPINAEFTEKRGKARFDPSWYSLDGIRTVRALAEHLGRLPEYEAFYSRGSQVMHSGTFRDHLIPIGSKIALAPIRHVSDMSALLRSVFVVTLGSYNKVVAAFLPHELEATREKYVRKWRPAFMGMPDFKFKYR